MDSEALKHILEASLLVAGRALSVAQLDALFEEDEAKPDRKMLREALESLQQDYAGRGIELVEVASGFRLQSRAAMEPWIGRLFPERAPRYSRALLETLVLIAYRQPITRGEIEEVRGVAVSSTIVKTLQERDWVKVVGHKEVPGRPALLATTKEFLDYFNLKRLEDLPPLSELKDLDQIESQLTEEIGLVSPGMQGDAANDSPEAQHGPPAPVWARQASAVAPEADPQPDLKPEPDPDPEPEPEPEPDPDPDPDPEPEPEEGSSKAQTELQRVIANFALEHRQQLDQQRVIADKTGAPEAAEAAVGEQTVQAAIVQQGDDQTLDQVQDQAPDQAQDQASDREIEATTDPQAGADGACPGNTPENSDEHPVNGRHSSDRPQPGDTLH